MGTAEEGQNLLKILYEEGGPLANSYLRRRLEIEKDKFDHLRTQLLEEGFVRVERKGLLTLTEYGEKEFERQHGGISAVSKEQELYEPLSEKLKQQHPQDIVLDIGHARRRSTWTNPDLARISACYLHLLQRSQVSVTTYEVKIWSNRIPLASVYETAAHGQFADYNVLVLEWATNIQYSAEKVRERQDLSRILSVCRRFGVGLNFFQFHPKKKRWELHEFLSAQRGQPTSEDVEDFLQKTLRRDEFKEDFAQYKEKIAPDQSAIAQGTKTNQETGVSGNDGYYDIMF